MTERPPNLREPVFVVRLRATDNAAAIRGLRWLLKTARRSFGLKALSVTEEAAGLGLPEEAEQ
jgi:hypothetical protein